MAAQGGDRQAPSDRLPRPGDRAVVRPGGSAGSPPRGPLGSSGARPAVDPGTQASVAGSARTGGFDFPAPPEPPADTAAGGDNAARRRGAVPRLQCKKCEIVYSGALPKAQRCMECEGPLVDADPPQAPQTPRPYSPGNDTAAPSTKPVGSPLLWAPGSSKRSELIVTRYLIKDPTTDILGSGAKGVVYRAQDRRMGNRPVAIKLFFDDALDESEAKREQSRTEREIKIQALLTHPAIVTAHDRFESPHGSGIVLEYIDGESLEDRVRKKGPLAPREAVRVSLELAKAVEFMHAQKIIHRDLKPANILITHDGNVKVIDFGVAKYKDDAPAEADARPPTPLKAEDVGITIDGSIVGTPSYMSPEQALGRVAWVDERSDIYGVGAILYFTVTGKAPFFGDDVEAILDRVRKLPPPAPSTWNPKVERPLEAIIEKSLRKLPEHRFQSAGALVGQLKRYLDGEPLDADVYVEPLSRRALRAFVAHKTAVFVGLVLVSAALLVVATMTYAKQHASDAAIEQRLQAADEKLSQLDVPGAIAFYNEVYHADPGNQRALQGLDAAQKAKKHVDLVADGRNLLEEAKKSAEAGNEDAEWLYERAYFSFRDARALGSPNPELEDLMKRARGLARLDVATPGGAEEAPTLHLVQLSPDDLADERLAAQARLPVKGLELPTGLYQASVEGKGLGSEPLYFPVKIARGSDVSIEAIPALPPGMIYVRGHPRFRPGHPRHDDLQPQPVEPFFMDRREVSVGEYRQFLESIKDPVQRKRRTPAHWTEEAAPEAADMPVSNVTTDDALAYARFRGKDLPNEAQWQLAASGGLDDRDYPYGRRFVPAFAHCSGSRPSAVGSHKRDRSPSGALDMGGNVSELVKGFFDPEGTVRLAKGGSFAKKAPLWERLPVNGPDRSIGFRCVRPLR